jgi:MinD superfamily P-loop ATPase
MIELVVVSGKGGTGKTSVTAALASSLKRGARPQVLVDCDVDAADLFLVLNPIKRETNLFKSGVKAVINQDECLGCSQCVAACRFGAISYKWIINPIKCEGCGACSLVCPNNAITLQENVAGEWYLSETRFGPLVHAKLGIAQDNSGKLVATIRSKAKELAITSGADLILIDGPPGIGCPVISSISGASALLIVTEPSPSGIHDLKRLCKLAEHFSTRVFVCINKYDIHLGNTAEIEKFCLEHKLPLVGNIPYSSLMNEAQNHGKNVFEFAEDRHEARTLTPYFERLQLNIFTQLNMETS